MIGPVRQAPRLAYAVLALAERGAPPSTRRPLRTDGPGEACKEGRVARPARRGPPLLHRRQRAADHPMAHADQAPPAYRLDPLRLEQPRQGSPAGLGGGACGREAPALPPE